MKTFTISERAYHDAVNDNAGFCINCMEFTADSGVEPDAEGYQCEVCDESTVMGTEEALLAGYLAIAGEEEDEYKAAPAR